MDDAFKKKKKINLKINGKLFPSYVMKNYKNFVIPKSYDLSGDPCDDLNLKKSNKEYDKFISKFMGYKSSNNSLLLYHDVGTGKTSKSIVLMNMLYLSDPNTNFFILIKSSIRTNWQGELNKWLDKQNMEGMKSSIHFVNYDSPNAKKAFEEEKKISDFSNKNVYIIDESQIFISRVLSNMRANKNNALSIYNEILKDKKENNCKILCMTATPAMNEPYELAVLFNLLRPDIFPGGENMFSKIFVDKSIGIKSLNTKSKNMFQRRIMGLVSYYKPGSIYGVYAKKITNHIDVEMSDYQTNKYNYWEDYENEIAKKAKLNSYESNTYKQYIRRASNFVLPDISVDVNNESRPKASTFQISNRLLEKINDGNLENDEITDNEKGYIKMLEFYKKEVEKYFDNIYEKDKKTKNNIENDINNFKKYETFEEYNKNEKNKSELIKVLIKCSCKYMAFIFYSFKSDGPIIYYMQNIILEGMTMVKIYLKYFGYNKYDDKKSKDYFKYGDFTGDADKKERDLVQQIEQDKDNVDGKLMKIIFFSSAGAEGITLYNIRQIHIIEPYWNEAKIEQLIGRGIRRCSHKMLPIEERVVYVFRYNSVKNKKYIEGNSKNIDDNKLKTVDNDIESSARNKNNVLESFYDAMKEVAVDCELAKNDNMRKYTYKCFKFNEKNVLDKNPGPAYREDINEDLKLYNNGSNSLNSYSVRTKVIKINGITDSGDKQFYWYCVETGTVYDYDLHYVVGKVKRDENEIIEKINNETYKIDVIEIPDM
jgi:hypothetical protein